MKADDKLDCRGLSCPEPILKLAGKMKQMNPGQVLEMLSDDAGALEDIPAWCRRTGCQVLAIGEEQGLITAFILKN